ncbi:hypothetical protein [Kosmotoga pacifica]|uniref:Uncharacterized protein n=1 Tax=Kosmotoga pacifica TaxID=1330330 RepID=A0A0G2ZCU7_9BACT|nr:hypothetical protein [Kosmotoga pacifica]AKI97384.1 hypothetical protein IX53_05620 [Kosmotoga pacifica]
MKKLVFIVLVLTIVSIAFGGGYFLGLGDVGNAYGIAGGLTIDGFTLFGYMGHASVMAVLGTGIGAAADLTPFELYTGVFGNYNYSLLLGAGAGVSIGLYGTALHLGAGVTIKVLWGEHYFSKTTVGFGLGGFYYDSVLAYVF